MKYFCAWCGKRVDEEGVEASSRIWYPFDSRECASAYGLRAGFLRVVKGDKAQTGLRFSTSSGLHSVKEQARGIKTRCPRCSSEEAFYIETGGLRSFTCYSCGYEYDELPNGALIHSRDDEAKSFLAVGDSSTRTDGLKALRDAIREKTLEGSRGRRKARREEDERQKGW